MPHTYSASFSHFSTVSTLPLCVVRSACGWNDQDIRESLTIREEYSLQLTQENKLELETWFAILVSQWQRAGDCVFSPILVRTLLFPMSRSHWSLGKISPTGRGVATLTNKKEPQKQLIRKTDDYDLKDLEIIAVKITRNNFESMINLSSQNKHA